MKETPGTDAAALDIYTDGGCSGNPGPGGWAWVLVRRTGAGETILAEAKGPERNTTNNRMELLAVISALKALKAMSPAGPSSGGMADSSGGSSPEAAIHTDSQYVQKGITEWIKAWKKNAWLTSGKKPVKNQDLWRELDALAGSLRLRWEWVRGHAGTTLWSLPQASFALNPLFCVKA